jgi:hypothetical protein
VWDCLPYEGPVATESRVELAQQNLRDHGVWFLASSMELARPNITYLDLSHNRISGQGQCPD